VKITKPYTDVLQMCLNEKSALPPDGATVRTASLRNVDFRNILFPAHITGYSAWNVYKDFDRGIHFVRSLSLITVRSSGSRTCLVDNEVLIFSRETREALYSMKVSPS